MTDRKLPQVREHMLEAGLSRFPCLTQEGQFPKEALTQWVVGKPFGQGEMLLVNTNGQRFKCTSAFFNQHYTAWYVGKSGKQDIYHDASTRKATVMQTDGDLPNDLIGRIAGLMLSSDISQQQAGLMFRSNSDPDAVVAIDTSMPQVAPVEVPKKFLGVFAPRKTVGEAGFHPAPFAD